MERERNRSSKAQLQRFCENARTRQSFVSLEGTRGHTLDFKVSLVVNRDWEYVYIVARWVAVHLPWTDESGLNSARSRRPTHSPTERRRLCFAIGIQRES